MKHMVLTHRGDPTSHRASVPPKYLSVSPSTLALQPMIDPASSGVGRSDPHGLETPAPSCAPAPALSLSSDLPCSHPPTGIAADYVRSAAGPPRRRHEPRKNPGYHPESNGGKQAMIRPRDRTRRATTRWWNRLLPAAAVAVMATFALASAALATPAPAVAGPQDRVAVIVQEASVFPGVYDDAEGLVRRLGGQVTQDLRIINGFSATVPLAAIPEIADYPGVRCITPDGPMVKTATTAQFTTWAVALGTSLPVGFVDATAAVDSALGPNQTYTAAYNKTCSFAGFTGEVTPGNRITKVEVVLHAYVPKPLDAGQDPKITVSVDGVVGKEVVYNHHGFDTFIGPAGAGTVYVDMTATRTWTWADFERALEVRIDQTKFKSTTAIYYDAIGLRVTSDAGVDATADYVAPYSVTAGPIAAGAQANVYNDVIGASTVWNEAGYLQGTGVTIAVVDSGVTKTPDLKGRNKKNVNFSATYHSAADVYGHGTFVAGVIAGDGKLSGGRYLGVAPKANLLNVRVSDEYGGCSESDVVAGLQWILENKSKYSIRVVNLSLNAAVPQSYQTSPLDAACEILWFNGITVVTSAGNRGAATLYPPANDPFVITVGATDDKGTASISDDTLAPFSSYGVSEVGLVKPELVAPGTRIIGLLPENDKLTMSRNKPQNRVDNTYFRMSGTSVSAPMVAGAIALLLQDEPALTPDQVKYRLMATANPNWPGYDPATCGAGYLDIHAAVHGETTASANTGLPASDLLTTGSNPIDSSVMWNSVMWNSVMWNSVMWNSVMWNSVMWNSDYWG